MEQKLEQVEKKVLSTVWDILETTFVKICNGTRNIRTITINREAKGTPLVLLHGMGAGVGFWVLNLQSLSKSRPVHAMDVIGFGRSSRPKFSPDAKLAEMEFIESIEDWRKEMKLNKFILLGHSLGGFLAASYAIKYPDRVRHLILVDPWGFPEMPMGDDGRASLPMWAKAVIGILQCFNPLSLIRVAGPLGPSLIARFRKDLTGNFSSVIDRKTVAEYVYYCNAQEPSGELAFKHITEKLGWAKYPMINRVKEIPTSVPMTVMYGANSWVDKGDGWRIKHIRNDSYVDIQVLNGAGHHVYADRSDLFNLLVNTTCNRVDQQIDLKSAKLTRRRMRGESSAFHSSPNSSASPHKEIPGSSSKRSAAEQLGHSSDSLPGSVTFSLAEEEDS